SNGIGGLGLHWWTVAKTLGACCSTATLIKLLPTMPVPPVIYNFIAVFSAQRYLHPWRLFLRHRSQHNRPEEFDTLENAFAGTHQCVFVLDAQNAVVADCAQGADEIATPRCPMAEAEGAVGPGALTRSAHVT